MTAICFATYAAILLTYLLVAVATGIAVVGPREPIPFSCALGLALMAQFLFLLGLVGMLRRNAILLLVATVLFAAALRLKQWTFQPRGGAIVIACLISLLPVFVLALYPATAFDETLYHLPFVSVFARSESLPFAPELRFPVFTQLSEVLSVPAFLVAGDAATHLVSLAEALTTAGLLASWGSKYDAWSGWIAAAVFAGSPIMVYLATTSYAEAALTLFVTAGFFCLDRGLSESKRWIALSGLFFGTACGVKYLGWYFVLAAGIIVAIRGADHFKASAVFAACVGAAALPTYGRIVFYTGNPIFPFFPSLFGSSAWDQTVPTLNVAGAEIRFLRILWDLSVNRDRLNQQPPFNPLFVVATVMIAIACFASRRARYLFVMVLGYLLVFALLPCDSRYLTPLIPLVSLAAAIMFVSVTRSPHRSRLYAVVAMMALAPGPLYAGYRIYRQGFPPFGPLERRVYLEKSVPEFRALERARRDRVYVCGAEQLKYLSAGELLGDFSGPSSYENVLANSRDAAELYRSLRRRGVDDLLISKRVCAGLPRRLEGFASYFVLLYEDGNAQLWRVGRISNPSSKSSRLEVVPGTYAGAAGWRGLPSGRHITVKRYPLPHGIQSHR